MSGPTMTPGEGIAVLVILGCIAGLLALAWLAFGWMAAAALVCLLAIFVAVNAE